MPLSSEEDEFLEVASSSLFRVIEMIAAFPVEHRAGAFEVAEHRYMQAARDFGCAEEAATRDDEAFENGVLRGGRSGKRFAVALAQSLDPDRGSQPKAADAERRIPARASDAARMMIRPSTAAPTSSALFTLRQDDQDAD